MFCAKRGYDSCVIFRAKLIGGSIMFHKHMNFHICCRDGAAFYGDGAYGSGTGPILLDNVVCSGLEDSLAQCHSHGWNNHNCDQSEAVGVSCVSGELL